MSGLSKTFVDFKLKTRQIMIFGKSNHPDSQQAQNIFEQYHLPKDSYEWIDIEKRQDCKQLENYFRYLCFTDRRQVPYIFINQLYFGSLFELNICHKNGSLKQILFEGSIGSKFHQGNNNKQLFQGLQTLMSIKDCKHNPISFVL